MIKFVEEISFCGRTFQACNLWEYWFDCFFVFLWKCYISGREVEFAIRIANLKFPELKIFNLTPNAWFYMPGNIVYVLQAFSCVSLTLFVTLEGTDELFTTSRHYRLSGKQTCPTWQHINSWWLANFTQFSCTWLVAAGWRMRDW